MYKKAFSLIEVLFAITFLIIVGVGMAALNNSIARLVESTELKITALELNDQAITYVAIKKRTLTPANFSIAYPCSTLSGGKTCYVTCPATPTAECSILATPAAVRVGNAKVAFTSKVLFVSDQSGGTKTLLVATTTWGSGIQKQISSSQIID